MVGSTVAQEIDLALHDARLKPHQRRAVAVVMLLSDCSRTEALRQLERWSRYKQEWSDNWEHGDEDSAACGGNIETQAAFGAFIRSREAHGKGRKFRVLQGGAK